MGRFSHGDSDSSETSAEVDPYLIADAEYGMPKNCHCGGQVDRETSYTEVDPGRRYFTCRLRENDGYHIRKWWDIAVEDELNILHCDIERLKEKLRNLGRTGQLKEGHVRKVEEEIEQLNDGLLHTAEQMAKLEMLVAELMKKKISVEKMTFVVVAALIVVLGFILILFK